MAVCCREIHPLTEHRSSGSFRFAKGDGRMARRVARRGLSAAPADR